MSTYCSFMFQLVNQTGITGYMVHYHNELMEVNNLTINLPFNTNELQFDNKEFKQNISARVAALSMYGIGPYDVAGPESVTGMYSL